MKEQYDQFFHNLLNHHYFLLYISQRMWETGDSKFSKHRALTQIRFWSLFTLFAIRGLALLNHHYFLLYISQRMWETGDSKFSKHRALTQIRPFHQERLIIVYTICHSGTSLHITHHVLAKKCEHWSDLSLRIGLFWVCIYLHRHR